MTARPVVPGGNTLTSPFSIPCSGSLAEDTLRTEFIADAGTLMVSNQQNTSVSYYDVLVYTHARGSVTVRFHNRTGTSVRVHSSAIDPRPWGGPEDEITFTPDEDRVIPPGGQEDWNLSLLSDWQSPTVWFKGLRSTAAPPAEITATLVFSIGPTARISRSLIIARPESMYLPVAAKELSAGW